MSAPFFILSLPRTRTAWLANFLTHDGVFAYHEGLLGCATVEDARNKLLNAPGEINGMVDGSAALILPQLLDVIPDANIVCLLGNASDSHTRLRRFLPNIPFAAIERLDAAITAVAMRDEVLALPVEFAHTPKGLQTIIERIAPGKQFHASRYEQLRDVNIQVDVERTRQRIEENRHAMEQLFGGSTMKQVTP